MRTRLLRLLQHDKANQLYLALFDAVEVASTTDVFDLDVLRRRLAAAPDGDRIKPLSLQTVVLGEGALVSPPGSGRSPHSR